MATPSTVEDFVELERLYADQPAVYRRPVFGLVCLGYGYIAFCLLLISGFLLGGAALLVSGKLPLGLVDNFLRIAVPGVVLAGLMLRAFFVRIPTPEGTYLAGALKDQVLTFVEPIREAAHGRPVQEVVIVNELNAAVQQQARFGLFGPTTNYLILGAPLLQVMSAAELKAVIAHEFGHLSHEHGRMGATVYRLDNTLRHAAQAIHDKARSGLANLSFKFFDWFYPRFNLVTFAMRRGQEYEADQVASRATSAEALVSALCRLHTLDQP
jgi:Zn-dependent protease with chaperone function